MQAVEYVKSGMVLGLGTGSTAAFAVAKIGELLKVRFHQSINLLRLLYNNNVSDCLFVCFAAGRKAEGHCWSPYF